MGEYLFPVRKITNKFSSINSKEDLQNFVYGGLPNFEEYEGVFNDGENGYRGNEGIIVFSDNKIQIPKEKDKYEDGLYLTLLSLF